MKTLPSVDQLNARAKPGTPHSIAMFGMLGRLNVRDKQGRVLRAFHLRAAARFLYELPRILRLLDVILLEGGTPAERQEARELVALAQDYRLIPVNPMQVAAE